jgi:hypothetical protein
MRKIVIDGGGGSRFRVFAFRPEIYELLFRAH